MVKLSEDTIKGALYGLAFGDAWGYITEFSPYSELIKTQPGIPEVLKISDDTQMSLYAIEAVARLVMENSLTDDVLLDLMNNFTVQNNVRKIFADEFVKFYYDSDNNRAPGNTCMAALRNYDSTVNPSTGSEGATNNSKGCGANMRAGWLGLLPYKREHIAVLAVLQAQTTHNHPTGWVAAAVTALMVHSLAHKKITTAQTLTHSLEIVRELKGIPSNIWIGAHEGFKEVETGLRELQVTFPQYLQESAPVDINSYCGEGWIAEEALFNAVAATTAHPDNFIASMETLVYTNGDSDSIAAIGGAFWGAGGGYAALGYDVAGNLEPRYDHEIAAATDFLVGLQK